MCKTKATWFILKIRNVVPLSYEYLIAVMPRLLWPFFATLCVVGVKRISFTRDLHKHSNVYKRAGYIPSIILWYARPSLLSLCWWMVSAPASKKSRYWLKFTLTLHLGLSSVSCKTGGFMWTLFLISDFGFQRFQFQYAISFQNGLAVSTWVVRAQKRSLVPHLENPAT